MIRSTATGWNIARFPAQPIPRALARPVILSAEQSLQDLETSRKNDQMLPPGMGSEPPRSVGEETYSSEGTTGVFCCRSRLDVRTSLSNTRLCARDGIAAAAQWIADTTVVSTGLVKISSEMDTRVRFLSFQVPHSTLSIHEEIKKQVLRSILPTFPTKAVDFYIFSPSIYQVVESKTRASPARWIKVSMPSSCPTSEPCRLSPS